MDIHDPIYNERFSTTEYSYVYFGRYPQSVLKEEEYSTWTEETWKKLWINRVGFCNLDGLQMAYNYYNEDASDAELYKVEPIRWAVLRIGEDHLLLMADHILEYGMDGTSSWPSGGLEGFLNGYKGELYDWTGELQSFFSRAFTEEEQQDMNQIKFYTYSDYVTILPVELVKNKPDWLATGALSASGLKREFTDYSRHEASGNGSVR